VVLSAGRRGEGVDEALVVVVVVVDVLVTAGTEGSSCPSVHAADVLSIHTSVYQFIRSARKTTRSTQPPTLSGTGIE